MDNHYQRGNNQQRSAHLEHLGYTQHARRCQRRPYHPRRNHTAYSNNYYDPRSGNTCYYVMLPHPPHQPHGGATVGGRWMSQQQVDDYDGSGVPSVEDQKLKEMVLKHLRLLQENSDQLVAKDKVIRDMNDRIERLQQENRDQLLAKDKEISNMSDRIKTLISKNSELEQRLDESLSENERLQSMLNSATTGGQKSDAKVMDAFSSAIPDRVNHSYPHQQRQPPRNSGQNVLVTSVRILPPTTPAVSYLDTCKPLGEFNGGEKVKTRLRNRVNQEKSFQQNQDVDEKHEQEQVEPEVVELQVEEHQLEELHAQKEDHETELNDSSEEPKAVHIYSYSTDTPETIREKEEQPDIEIETLNNGHDVYEEPVIDDPPFKYNSDNLWQTVSTHPDPDPDETEDKATIFQLTGEFNNSLLEQDQYAVANSVTSVESVRQDDDKLEPEPSPAKLLSKAKPKDTPTQPVVPKSNGAVTVAVTAAPAGAAAAPAATAAVAVAVMPATKAAPPAKQRPPVRQDALEKLKEKERKETQSEVQSEREDKQRDRDRKQREEQKLKRNQEAATPRQTSLQQPRVENDIKRSLQYHIIQKQQQHQQIQQNNSSVCVQKFEAAALDCMIFPPAPEKHEVPAATITPAPSPTDAIIISSTNSTKLLNNNNNNNSSPSIAPTATGAATASAPLTPQSISSTASSSSNSTTIPIKRQVGVGVSGSKSNSRYRLTSKTYATCSWEDQEVPFDNEFSSVEADQLNVKKPHIDMRNINLVVIEPSTDSVSNEDTSDKAFKRRHKKCVLDEIKMKNLDARNQKRLANAPREDTQDEVADSLPKSTFYPLPDYIEVLEFANQVPVQAFGENMVNMEYLSDNFSLPKLSRVRETNSSYVFLKPLKRQRNR